ncbi:MAG: ABC transporter ATP-binding protein [Planctomycetota bacterium]|jgi:lipoprotein-releasing system ATP-binding protein|nr:ABC transporter ATP-binding protein [Planctomycetota bacterium]
MPALIVEQLTKTFHTQMSSLDVLREISFSMEQGENMVVVGPSGSGKSTLLHILGTLDSPSSGVVEINGQNPFELPDKDLANFRNRNVGFVFQEHHLLPQLTVLENVLIPTLAAGSSTPEQIDRANRLIEQIGLAERMNHRPAQLSGGERQRVAIARSLIFKPSILLADEPTGSLDQENSNLVGEMLLRLQQAEKAMLVVVTHSAELAGLFSRQLEFSNGRVTEQPNSAAGSSGKVH